MEIKTLRQNSPTFVMKIFDNRRWRTNRRRKIWDRPIRLGSEPDLLLLDAEIPIVIINHLSSVKTYCNWYLRHEVNKRDFLSLSCSENKSQMIVKVHYSNLRSKKHRLTRFENPGGGSMKFLSIILVGGYIPI
jgi:hypothetical protein